MKKQGRIHKIETMWQDLILVIVGVFTLFLPNLVLLPAAIGYALLLFGLTLAGAGLAELTLIFYWQDPDRLKRWHKQRMKQANSGVVWVWAVCLAGICVYAIAFYVCIMPTLEVIGIVEGMTSFDSDAAFTLNLAKAVLNWHPIIFIVGLLLWAFVNSVRREDVTYPAY